MDATITGRPARMNGGTPSYARGEEIDGERPDRGRRTPALQMRLMLTSSKQATSDFERAWSRAWENIVWPHGTEERQDWKEVLALMRPVFREAFENMDPQGVMRLLASSDYALNMAA